MADGGQRFDACRVDFIWTAPTANVLAKWGPHDVETLSVLLALCVGNHFWIAHAKGPVIRSFDVSFLVSWNKLLKNSRVSGDVKRLTPRWRHSTANSRRFSMKYIRLIQELWHSARLRKKWQQNIPVRIYIHIFMTVKAMIWRFQSQFYVISNCSYFGSKHCYMYFCSCRYVTKYIGFCKYTRQPIVWNIYPKLFTLNYIHNFILLPIWERLVYYSVYNMLSWNIWFP